MTPKTTPTLTYTQTNVSCNGASDGSIVVTAANGIAPYQYSINGGPFIASNVFNGLPAGGYNVVVRDSKNCPSLATVVTITEPTLLEATASATPFSCSATNTKQSALITVTATVGTGTAPYQYSFNNGVSYSSSNTLTVNDNGSDQTFSYVVKDANGCLTAAQNITLTKLDPPTDLTFSSAAITCSDPTTIVTVTAINGVGPLEYETIAPSPIIVGKQASNSFAGLTPGTYIFQVTDANGCYTSGNSNCHIRFKIERCVM